jgi:hypothetical protein
MSKMSSVKQAVIDQIAEKKGLVGDEPARLDATLRRVGWVESKNNPEAVQEGGGPGRGKHQHELGASTDALKQRLVNYEKTYGPVPLTEEDRAALKKGDMSKVSEDGQDALTLVGWVMKTPGDEVGELARGEYKPGQFWLDYHWAGAEEDIPKKKEQWMREMNDYRRVHGGTN